MRLIRWFGRKPRLFLRAEIPNEATNGLHVVHLRNLVRDARSHLNLGLSSC